MKKNVSNTGNKQQKEAAKLKKQLRRVMSQKQIELYLQYAESEEALAVLFVKKHLPDARGFWIDILETDAPEEYRETKLEFRQVTCALYPRKLQPEYPPRQAHISGRTYLQICRAITWKTAHYDIARQNQEGVLGRLFVLNGYKEPNANGYGEYCFLSVRELLSE